MRSNQKNEIMELFEQSGLTIAELIDASGKTRNTISVALQDSTKVRPSTRHAIRTALLAAVNPEPKQARPPVDSVDPQHMLDMSVKTTGRLETELERLRDALVTGSFPFKNREFVGLVNAFAKVEVEMQSIKKLVSELP